MPYLLRKTSRRKGVSGTISRRVAGRLVPRLSAPSPGPLWGKEASAISFLQEMPLQDPRNMNLIAWYAL